MWAGTYRPVDARATRDNPAVVDGAKLALAWNKPVLAAARLCAALFAASSALLAKALMACYYIFVCTPIIQVSFHSPFHALGC